MKKTIKSLFAALVAGMFLFTATVSFAANGVWNGTVDALWTNSANWSASPYPSGPDMASFTNAGNGQTTIDLSGLTSITYMTFDSPAVSAYTNGTGVANSQTLVLADNGIITLTDTAANSQVVNAALQLGPTIAGSTYTINNLNTNQTLTFNNVFGPASGGTAGGKTLVVSGAGNTRILGDVWRGGATSLTLTHTSSGTLNLAGSNTVLTLIMNGGSNSIVDIGNGYLSLENGGSAILTSSQGGTINGSGTIRLSTGGGVNYGDVKPAAGKTLVINPTLVSIGGFELNDAGTAVLNGSNTFDGDVFYTVNGGTISVSKIGNQGATDSNLGKGKKIFMTGATNCRLLYTGTGETTDRIIALNQNFVIEHAGTGTLTFSTPFQVLANTKTLTLQGSTAGVGVIPTTIAPGSGTTSLTKNGSGTWVLSAANGYGGATTVSGGTLILSGADAAITNSSSYTINPGGTLLLDNATANNTNRLRDASGITLNGGTLSITNNGGAVNYRENAGALSIGPGGTSTIATLQADTDQTNTLTFASLTYNGGKINFTGTGLGESDRNRIFIAGLANGPIGPWATVNGTSYAAYSSTLGVYALTTGFTDVAAEGGVPQSVIPDNTAALASISLPGISGPITLQGAWTNSIAQVQQNTTTNTTIETLTSGTNKLLRTAGLSIAAGKAALTVGTSPNHGYLSPLSASGTIVLENNNTAELLTVNAALVNNVGASKLSKTGPGTVVLAGTNTYSGNTYISEGVLVLGSSINQTVAAAISGGGALAKTGASTLTLSPQNFYTGGTRIDGESTVTLGNAGSLGTGAVTNNGTLNILGGNNVTITGLATALSGAGTNNVTLGTGSQSTALDGNYSAFTGVWDIGINAAAGAGRATMNGLDNGAAIINVRSNATLWISLAGTHYATAILKGGDTGESYGQLRLDTCTWAGPVILASPITSTADAFLGSQNANSTISGVISEVGGPYEVSKIGATILTLTGSNTFAGPVYVKGGAISVPVMGSISGVASPLGKQTSAAAGKVRMGNGGTAASLIYTGAGEDTDRMIDLAGTTGGATLDHSGTGVLKLTGGMMISGTGAKTITLQGSTVGTAEFAGAITNGTGSTIALTKAGTGTWTLSGTNAYSGATTISAGTLNLTGSITNSAITMSGTLLDISGSIGNGNITISGGTAPRVIARSATALGTGEVIFSDAGGTATKPSLEVKIDGGGTIALPNRIRGNSTLVDTIDVNNNGIGTGGVIQFNGPNCDFGNTTINVTGANGYSLYIDQLRNTAGGSGTMTLNPTTAALGIGTISGSNATDANSYVIKLDGTHLENTITGMISNKSGSANTVISILKTNSSTWTLTGTSTYTGATTVNGGTLLVNAPGSLGAGSAVTVNNGGILGGNGTLNGAVTVNGNGKLAPGGINNVDTLTMASTLTLNGGQLLFDVSNVSTDKVAVAGALILNNNTVVDLAISGGTLAQGTYTLMTYASISGSGTVTLSRVYPNATLTPGATSLTLTVGPGGIGTGMVWKGTYDANWDSAQLNWNNEGTATNFFTGDAVTFDDTAIAFTVASSGSVLPGSVVFNNATDYTVSAAIDGTAPFIKLGIGTTALTGITNYNPSTLVLNEGMLTLGGASTLNSGLYAGTIINDGILNYASSVAQTNSGSITGFGSLIQSGSGTLTLLSSNAFSGTVTVQAGSILQAKNAFALGALAGGTTVQAGGTLDLSDNISFPAEALNLYGTLSSQTGSNTYAGVVSLQTGSSVDVGLGSLLILTASTLNVGPSPFSKTGDGTLRLTADPNHAGVCTVAEGILEIRSTSGNTDADFIINAGATLMETYTALGDYRLTNNGTFDIRASDQIGGLDGSGVVTIGNTGSYNFQVGGNNQSGAFSGVMQDGTGKLSFQKNNSGTQILTGMNTYTGATLVAGGTLLINTPGSLATNSTVTANNNTYLGGTGAINGPVNMAGGSTLLPGGLNAIGTLTLGNDNANALTLNDSFLRFDLSNVEGDCDLIALTGSSGGLVLNGINIVQLNFLNGSAPVGDYTLMTFKGYTGAGILALATAYPNATLELTTSNLVLHVTGASTSGGLTWTGLATGTWDTGTLNWSDGTSPALFTTGAHVTFEDTPAINLTVSSGGAVSPASMFFNNSVNAYTISANVAGTGPLVKLGSQSLTLSGLTTYNPTSIALSYCTVTLSTASTLNSGNYAGPINNNANFTYTSTAAQTLSGVISGSGALIKDSTSTMTLSGTNTYTGNTTIRGGGTLKILNGNALGTTAGNTTVTNAILEISGNNITTLAEGLTLYGILANPAGTNTYSGAITMQPGAILNVGAGSTLNVAASITGSAPFSKIGAGALRLTVDPNNTGAMTISNGVAEITSGTTDGDVIINSGATFIASGNAVNDAKSVTVNAGGVYELRGSDVISSFNGSGLTTIGSANTYTLTVGNGNTSATFSGVLQNGLGTLAFTKAGTGTQTLSGVNTFSGNMNVTGTLLLTGAGQFGAGLYAGTIVINAASLFVHDSSAAQTLSNVISGAGALRKIGSGKLILSGVNTYSGGTSISNGVLVGVTGGSCASSAVTNAAAAGKSATLGVLVTDITKQWTCSSLTVNNAGVSSGLEIDFGYLQPSTNVPPLKISGALTLTTPPALTIKGGFLPVTTGNGYPLMTWGSGSAAGITVVLPPRLTGSVVVIGTTNYLQITANNGPLTWATSGSGTWNTNTSNTAWNDLVGAATAYSEANLPGDQVVFADTNLTADTVVTLNTIVTPARVTVTNDAYSYTISGSGGIAGGVGVTKSGTNTLTLGTANTFTGLTALNDGTLKLANASALPAGNIVTMAGKGTLDMNGNATALTNITASTAANTIIDTSAGAGTTALSILNQTTTIVAAIKDGASRTLAVNLANLNGGTAAFALNTSNTFSGGLTLKHTAGSGTRLVVGNPVITVGTPGSITSSPFGRGPITIGEAAADRAGIYMNANNATIANELIVNTTNGTDLVGMALRAEGTGIRVDGKVTANASLTMGCNTGTPSVTLTNAISGAGGVTLAMGNGTLTATLTGPNTYEGKTVVNKGTLAFTSVSNVGGGASALGAPITTQAGTIALGSGGTGVTLSYRGMGHTTDRVLELASTTGTITLDHSGTNLLKFTSDLLVSGIGAKQLRLQGSTVSTGEVAGVISDSASGAVNLLKEGPNSNNTWRLSGVNTFTGGLEINMGKLIVAHSSALGVGNKTVKMTNGTAGRCQLYLDGSVEPVVLETNISYWVSNTADPGTIYNVAGTNTIKGEIRIDSGGGGLTLYSYADKLTCSGLIRAINTGRAVNLRGNGDGEVSGTITNGLTPNLPVTKDQGTGTWTLSGTNTYTGTTTINTGTLAAGNDQAFGTGLVNLTGGNLGGALGTWTIANTVNVPNNSGIKTEGTLILSGLVTNNAALNKTGAGTLLLNGSILGTRATTVSEGVLGGTGTIAGTVTNLATITAADTNSIGALTVSNLAIGSGSTLFWNCNAVTQDVINVTGTLTLPTVATVIVDEDTVGDLGVAPRVLFTFTTGPAPTLLSNWVIVGAPQGTFARVSNNQVYLYRTGGTMISIF